MYQVIAGNIFCNFLCLSSCLGKSKLWGGHASFLKMFKTMMQFPSFARTKTLRRLMETSLIKKRFENGIEY